MTTEYFNHLFSNLSAYKSLTTFKLDLNKEFIYYLIIEIDSDPFIKALKNVNNVDIHVSSPNSGCIITDIDERKETLQKYWYIIQQLKQQKSQFIIALFNTPQ